MAAARAGNADCVRLLLSFSPAAALDKDKRGKRPASFLPKELKGGTLETEITEAGVQAAAAQGRRFSGVALEGPPVRFVVVFCAPVVAVALSQPLDSARRLSC